MTVHLYILLNQLAVGNLLCPRGPQGALGSAWTSDCLSALVCLPPSHEAHWHHLFPLVPLPPPLIPRPPSLGSTGSITPPVLKSVKPCTKISGFIQQNWYFSNTVIAIAVRLLQ